MEKIWLKHMPWEQILLLWAGHGLLRMQQTINMASKIILIISAKRHQLQWP